MLLQTTRQASGKSPAARVDVMVYMEDREIAYFKEKHFFFLGSDVSSSILASKQYFLLIVLIILDGRNHFWLRFSHVLV